MKKNILTIAAMAMLMAASACGGKKTETPAAPDNFVTVRDGQFYIGDSLYRYVGTNFWYGAILASEGRGGNRERLKQELDKLQELGVNNLRILAGGGDGEEGLMSHISPVMQTAPGVYNDTILRGLDYLLAELEERDMKAVVFLNNSWEWSGGFSAYLSWATGEKAPNPGDMGYPAYMEAVSEFVRNDKAKELAAQHTRNIVSRVNTVTGKPYAESPAIMAWQIANEPRPFSKKSMRPFAKWIEDQAKLIKSIDQHHLVSTGNEGSMGSQNSIDLWAKIHAIPEVDYATIHIWPYNWTWIRSDQSIADSVGLAIEKTHAYINEHYEALASELSGAKKPIVIEEFGYPRDEQKYHKESSVRGRDTYYRYVFSEVADSGKVAGANFWAWGGFAQPRHSMWEPGDDYCGDPAQEAQGLNSVFVSDSTTIDIIKQATTKIQRKK